MNIERCKKTFPVLLLIAIGLFFRVYRLGDSSLQIDNFMFWDLLHRDVSVAQIFSEWTTLVGLTGQLPLAAAAAKAFVEFFHVPLSFGGLIFPFALCGTLVVPVAYASGLELRGRKMALFLAAVVTFSPICIQASREAYFYVGVLLGSFFSLWAIGISSRLYQQKKLPFWFHGVNATAFFLMTWSSPSTWPYAFCFAVYQIGLVGWQSIRYRKNIGHLVVVLLSFLLIGLPILLSDWGLTHILEFTSDGATRDYWTQVFAVGRNESQWAKIWPVLGNFGWGGGWLRQIFLVLVLALGLKASVSTRRENPAVIALGVLFAIVLVLNILAVQKSVWSFGPMRAMSILPIYLFFLSAGLLSLVKENGSRCRRLVGFTLPVLGLALWAEALFLIPAVTGKSRPYQEMANWVDANLPPGTPIVTERFFTAYNEYRVHPSTNSYFISVAPNQIPKQYKAFNFRERVSGFFDANPVAGFIEEKHLWNRSEIGPWPEIEKRFARSHSVTNQAGLRLAQLGLCYRRPATRPVPKDSFTCTILYNLPKDLVTRARKEGQEFPAFFSEGWKTVSTRDYRLWRLLEKEAIITVWNLTDEPQDISLVINGVAAGGVKQVRLNNHEKKLFSKGRMVKWISQPIRLNPGKNQVTLSDTLRTPQTPLLVSSINFKP